VQSTGVTVIRVIRFFFLKITIRVSVRDRRFLAADDPMIKPSEKTPSSLKRAWSRPAPATRRASGPATVSEFDAKRRTVRNFPPRKALKSPETAKQSRKSHTHAGRPWTRGAVGHRFPSVGRRLREDDTRVGGAFCERLEISLRVLYSIEYCCDSTPHRDTKKRQTKLSLISAAAIR
jgi:hypothetical protein